MLTLRTRWLNVYLVSVFHVKCMQHIVIGSVQIAQHPHKDLGHVTLYRGMQGIYSLITCPYFSEST